MITDSQQLKTVLQNELSVVKITDVHTHVFPADFGSMLLFGIDEVLTYHYLIAEFFRYSTMPYGVLCSIKSKQADLIWQTLFLDHSPVVSPGACLTVLRRLGLDVQSRSLEEYREYYRSRPWPSRLILSCLGWGGRSGHDK